MPRGRTHLVRLEPYLWMLPAVAFLVLFVLFPILFSLGLSLFDWSGVTPLSTMRWIGGGNYAELFDDPIFRQALTNTLVFSAVTTAAMTVLSFVLAFSLWYRSPKWAGVARAVIFYPAIISGVIIALTWTRLLALDGPVNALITSITRSPSDTLWLANIQLTFWVVVVVQLWWNIGLSTVLYQAGMTQISRDVTDSAAIDGATSFALARHIVEPMTRPTGWLVILLNLVYGLLAFTLIFVLTAGGPVHTTDTISTYGYWLAFGFNGPNRVAYSAAVANLAVLALAGVAMWRLRRAQ